MLEHRTGGLNYLPPNGYWTVDAFGAFKIQTRKRGACGSGHPESSKSFIQNPQCSDRDKRAKCDGARNEFVKYFLLCLNYWSEINSHPIQLAHLWKKS